MPDGSVSIDSTYSAVAEAADLIEVGCIVEADHIVDIAERRDIAGEARQEKMVDIAGEKMDIVDLVLPAGEGSSVLCRWANYRMQEYTSTMILAMGTNISRPNAPL